MGDYLFEDILHGESAQFPLIRAKTARQRPSHETERPPRHVVRRRLGDRVRERARDLDGARLRVPQVIWPLQQGGSLLCGYLRHMQTAAAVATTAPSAAIASATTAVTETRRATVASARTTITSATAVAPSSATAAAATTAATAATAAGATTTTIAMAARGRLLTIPHHAQPGGVWLATATLARVS